jgi:hypothetical protein
MSPTRSGYKELGIELVSLEETIYRSDLPWRDKIKKMGNEILSKCFLRKPSRNKGTR